METIRVQFEPLEVRLAHPFKIAYVEQTHARNIIARLSFDGIDAIGETSPFGRYHESVESVLEYYEKHPVETADPLLLQNLIDPAIPPAARCALDTVLYDYLGKRCGLPVHRVLGLDPEKTPLTSFTVGIGPVDDTVEKVKAIGDHPVLKVKLGSGTAQEQIETVRAIRSVYTGAIRLDANEGWDVDSSVSILRELERSDIEFCEQPIPAGNPDGLRYIKEHCSIPIMADEDVEDAADIPPLHGCVDAVNVKLVKTGGIRGALDAIATARAHGMKIMLGSMLETGILTSAAAQISPLVDWADLDGPFLLERDPYPGVQYVHGKLVLPRGPGLGVGS